MQTNRKISFTRKLAYGMCAFLACFAVSAGATALNFAHVANAERTGISARADATAARPLRNYNSLEVTLRNENAKLYSGATTGAGIKSNLSVIGSYYSGSGNEEVELYPVEYIISIDGEVIGDDDTVDLSVTSETGEVTLLDRVSITIDCGKCSPKAVNMDVAPADEIPLYDSIRVEVPSTPVTNDHTSETLKNIIKVFGQAGEEETEIINKDLISVTILTANGEIGTATSVRIRVTYLAGTMPEITAMLNTGDTAKLQSVSVAVNPSYSLDKDGYYKDGDGNAVFHTDLQRQAVSEKLEVTVFYPNSYYVLQRLEYGNGTWSTATGESYTLNNNSFSEGINELTVQVNGRAGTQVLSNISVSFETVKVDRVSVVYDGLAEVTPSTTVRQLINSGNIKITARTNTGAYVDNYTSYRIEGVLAPTAEDIEKCIAGATTYDKKIRIINQADGADTNVEGEVIITGIKYERPTSFGGFGGEIGVQTVYGDFNFDNLTVQFRYGATPAGRINVPLDELKKYVTVDYYTDEAFTELSGKDFVTKDVKGVLIKFKYPGMSEIEEYYIVENINRAIMELPVSSTSERDFIEGLFINVDTSEYEALLNLGRVSAEYSDVVKIDILTDNVAVFDGNQINVISGGELRFRVTLLDTENWAWPQNLNGAVLDGNSLLYTIQINRGEFDVRLKDVSMQYGGVPTVDDFDVVGLIGNDRYTFGTQEGDLDIGVTLYFYGWENWTYNNPSSKAPTEVGNYYVIAVTDDTPAYITSKTTSGNAARLIITPKKVYAQNLLKDVYYDRNEHGVTEFFDYTGDFLNKDFVDGKAPVKLTGDVGPYVHVSEEGYSITLTITSNNYVWDGENVTQNGKAVNVTFNLKQYNNSLSPVMNGFIYGSTGAKGATYVTGTPFFGIVGEPVYYTSAGKAVTETDLSKWPAGDYYVEFTTSLEGEDTELDVTLPKVKLNFTVEKRSIADITVSVDGGADEVVYRGLSGYGITLNGWNQGNYTNGIISVSVEGVKYDEGGTAFTEAVNSSTGKILLYRAGTYTITVAIDNPNYKWSGGGTDPIVYDTFKILRRKLTVVGADSADTVYDGNEKTYAIENLPDETDLNGDELSSVLSYAVSGLRHDGLTVIAQGISGDITAITATQAGVYKISVTLEETDNYEWDGETPEVFEWIISKASLEIIGNPDDGEYAGSSQTVTLANWNKNALNVSAIKGTTFGGADISVSAANENKITLVHAGTYTFTVEITDKHNYEWADNTTADISVEYVMRRATLSVNWGETSFKYDGSAKAPSPEVNGGTIEDTDGISYSGHTEIYTDESLTDKISSATAAGKYYFKITGFDGRAIEGQKFTTAHDYVLPDEVSVIFVIDSAELSAPSLYVSGGDGVKLSGSNLLYADYRGSAYKFSNYLRGWGTDYDDKNLVLEVSGGTAVGHNAEITDVIDTDGKATAYAVYVYPNTNYKWASGVSGLVDHDGKDALVFYFRVDKLEVSLNWTDGEYVYDGGLQSPVLTITNMKNNDDVSAVIGDKKTSSKLSAINAGEYTAYALGLEGERAFNYKVSDVNPEYEHGFTIKKQIVVKPVSDTLTGVYGTDTSIAFNGGDNLDYWNLFTVTVSGANRWLSVPIEVTGGAWSGEGVFSFVNAGTYSFVFKMADSANYCWADEAATEQTNFDSVAYEFDYEDYITIERRQIAPPSLTPEGKNLRAQPWTGGVLSPAEVITGNNVLDYHTLEIIGGLGYTVEYSVYAGTPSVPDSIARGEYSVKLTLGGADALNYVWNENTSDTNRGYVTNYANYGYDTTGVTVTLYYAITLSQLSLDVSINGYTYGDTENVADPIAEYIVVGGDDAGIVEGNEHVITATFYKNRNISEANKLTDDELYNGFPRNAGTYYVQVGIKFTGDIDYEAPLYNLTGDSALTVAKKVIVINWNDEVEADYDGLPHIKGAALDNPSFGDTIDLVTGLAATENAVVAGAQNGVPVNVKRDTGHTISAYSVLVTGIAGEFKDNYTVEGAADNSASFTINPVNLTIKADGSAITYGDEFDTASGFGYTVTGGFKGGDTAENLKELITVSGNPFIMESVSGTAYAPGATAGAVDGEYVVRLALNADNSVNGITAQNYVVIQDNGDYNSVTVQRKNITLTVNHGIAYSDFGDPIVALDADSLLSADKGVMVSGDTPSGIGVILATTAVSGKDGVYSIAGGYLIGFNGTEISASAQFDNYVITLDGGDGAYEIKVKEVSVVWVEKTYEYNGKVQTIGNVAYYTDATHDEATRNVWLNVSADKTFKNAGDYTFTASFSGTAHVGRYSLKTDTITNGGYKIDKYALSVKGVDVTDHVYGDDVTENEKLWDYAEGGREFFEGKDAAGAHLTVSIKDGVKEVNSLSPAGSGYKVNVTAIQDGFTGNYDITFIDGGFTILRREIRITVNRFAQSVYNAPLVDLNRTENPVYDISLLNGSGEAVANGAAVSSVFTLSLETGVTSVSPVGKYAVLLTVVNDNYDISFTEYTPENGVNYYAILSAAISVENADGYGGVYDAAAHAVLINNRASAENGQKITWFVAAVDSADAQADESTVWVESGSATRKDAGTYYYLVKVCADNHAEVILNSAITVTIDKAELTVRMNMTITYGENAPNNYDGKGNTWHKAMEWLRGDDIYEVTGFKGADEAAFRNGTLSGLVNPEGNAFTYTTDYRAGDGVNSRGYELDFIANGLASANYTFVSAAGKLIVEPLKMTVAIKNQTSNYYFQNGDKPEINQRGTGFDLSVTSVGAYGMPILDAYAPDLTINGGYENIFVLNTSAFAGDTTNSAGSYPIYPVTGDNNVYDNYEITFTGSWDGTPEGIDGAGNGTYTVKPALLDVNSDIRGFRAGSPEQGADGSSSINTDTTGVPYDEREHFALQHGIIKVTDGVADLSNENKNGYAGDFAKTVDGSAIKVRYFVADKATDSVDWNGSGILDVMPKFIDAGTHYVFYRIEAPNHEAVYGANYYGRVEIARAPNAFVTHFGFEDAPNYEWKNNDDYADVTDAAWTYGALDNDASSDYYNPDGYSSSGKQRATTPVTAFSRIPGSTLSNKIQITVYFRAFDSASDSAIFTTDGGYTGAIDINVILAKLFSEGKLGAGYYRVHFEMQGNDNYENVADYHTFKVAKKALTVTANSFTEENSLIYGAAAPYADGTRYGYVVSGLVNNGTANETVTDAIGKLPVFTSSYAAGYEYGSVGDHAITLSGAYDSDNYDVTFVDGIITVIKREVAIDIDYKTNRYNLNVTGSPEERRELTYSVVSEQGFFAGDSEVIKLKTNAFVNDENEDSVLTRNVGKYPIYALFLKDGGGASYSRNYEITFEISEKPYEGEIPDEAIAGGAGTYEITTAHINISIDGTPYYVNEGGQEVQYPEGSKDISTYDGKEKIYKAAIFGYESGDPAGIDAFAPVYYVRNGGVYEAIDFTPKDVGSYMVTFTSSNSNYDTGSMSFSYTISPRTLEVSAAVENVKENPSGNSPSLAGTHYYNGAAYEVVYTLKNFVVGEKINYSVSYEGEYLSSGNRKSFGDKGETLPTFAGEYQAILTLGAQVAGNGYKPENYAFAEGGNTHTDGFTISRALVYALSGSYEQTVTYNGRPQDFKIDSFVNWTDYQGVSVLKTVITAYEIVAGNGGTARLTFTEKRPEVSGYMGTGVYALSATNAGVYKIKVSIADTDNYAAVNGAAEGRELTFTILRASLTVTATNATVQYGTPLATAQNVQDAVDGGRFGGFGATYVGLKNGETAGVFATGVSYATEAYNTALAGGATAQGNAYDVVPSGIVAYNYVVDRYVNGTLTVSKRNITVTVNGISSGNLSSKHTYTGVQQQETLNKLLADNISSFLSPDAEAFGVTSDGLKELGIILRLPSNAKDVGKYGIVCSVELSSNYKVEFEGSPDYEITKAPLNVKIGLYNPAAGYDNLVTAFDVTYGDTAGVEETANARFTLRYKRDDWQNREGNENGFEYAETVSDALVYTAIYNGTNYAPHVSRAGEVYKVGISGLEFKNYEIILHSADMTVVSRLITATSSDEKYTEEEGDYHGGAYGVARDAKITFTGVNTANSSYVPRYDLVYNTETAAGQIAGEAPVRAGEYRVSVNLASHKVGGKDYYDYKIDTAAQAKVDKHVSATDTSATLEFNVAKKGVNIYWSKAGNELTFGEIMTEDNTNRVPEFLSDIMLIDSFVRMSGEISYNIDSKYYTYENGVKGFEFCVYDVGQYFLNLKFNDEAYVNYSFEGSALNEVQISFNVKETNATLTVTIEGWIYNGTVNAPQSDLVYEGTHDTTGNYVVFTYAAIPDGTTDDQIPGLSYSSVVPSNAGRYAVRGVFPGNGDIGGARAYATFEISKATIEVPKLNMIGSGENQNSVYTGTRLVLNFVSNGKNTFNAATMNVSYGGNMRINGSEVELYATEANTAGYAVTFGLNDGVNYEWKTGTSEDQTLYWIVSPADDNEITGLENVTVKYGEALSFGAAATYGGRVTYTYALREDGKPAPADGWSTTVPGTAGLYWVKAESSALVNDYGIKNYNDADAVTAEITISKLTLTATANGGVFGYGETFDFSKGYGVTFTGFINGDSESDVKIISPEYALYHPDTGSAVTEKHRAGINYVIALATENGYVKGITADNYDIVTHDPNTGSENCNTVAVTPKAISITVGNLENVYGDIATIDGVTVALDGGSALAVWDKATTSAELKTLLGITLTCAEIADAYTDAGSYRITAAKTNADYEVNFTAGIYTVNPRQLTVSSIIVDGANSFRNVTAAKFKVEGYDQIFDAENNVVGGDEHGAEFVIRYLGRTNSNQSYNPTENVPVEAGNYTVVVALADGVKNYILTGAANAPFVVERATIDGSLIKAPSQTYNGENRTPVIDLSGLGEGFAVYNADGTTVDNWYTATFDNNMWQVGIYTGSLTLSASVTANYKWLNYDVTRPITFEITAVGQGENSITIISVRGWVYDGTDHIDRFNASATFGTVSWMFRENENSAWTSVAPVNAGTYFVKAYVAATANFAGAETDGSTTFEIEQRKINVTITSPAGNVYNGNILPATATVRDGEVGGMLDVSGADVMLVYSGTANNGTVFGDSVAVPALAGSYKVKARLGDLSNYVIANPDYSADFEVAKATVYGADVILTADYNGREQRVGGFVEVTEGYIAGLYVLDTTADDLHGDYLGMSDTVRTVGYYNVKLKLTDTYNYQWAASLTRDEYRRINLVITPAKQGAVTMSVTAAAGAEMDWIFGENELELNRYKISAKIDGYELPKEDYIATLQFAERGSAGYPTNWNTLIPVRAGNYFVRVEMGGDNIRLGTSDNVAFVIERRKLNVNVKAYDGVYGENPRTAIIDVTLPDGTHVDVSGKLKEVSIPEDAIEIMYYGVSNNGIWNRPDASSAQAVMPVLAGKYYVYAQIAPEYRGDIEVVGGNTSARPVGFVIERKTLNVSTVSVQENAIYYKGRSQAVNADYIADQPLHEGTVGDYATVKVTAGTDAGRYPVKLTFTAEYAANYCWAVPDGEEGTAGYAERTLYYVISVGTLTVNTPSKANWIYGNNPGNLVSGGAQFSDGTPFAGELIAQYRLINDDPTSGIEAVNAVWTESEPTEAGIYEVRMTALGTANYPTAYSAESRFTINRARLDLPGFGTDRTESVKTTYNARSQNALLNGVDTDTMYYAIVGAGSYDLERRVLTLVATDSGEYTVTVSIRNTRNYEWNSDKIKDQTSRTYTWTIEPAGENTILGFTVENWTYGENGLDGISVTTRFEGEVKYFHSTDGVTFENGLPVNAGTYTIKVVSSSLGGNYEEDSATARATVFKACLTAIPNAGSLVYGSTFTGGFGYRLSGFMNGDTASVVSDGGVTYSLTSSPARLTVGTVYKFVLDSKTVNVDGTNRKVVNGLSAENYYIVTAEGKLEITKKSIVVSLGTASSRFSDPINLDGVEVTTAENAFAFADESVESLGLTLATTARPLSNVGGYPIFVEDYTNNNYDVTFTSGVYTVYAVRVRVDINPGKGVYGGEMTAPVVKQFYLLSGEPVDLSGADEYIELEFVYSGTANDGTVYTNSSKIPALAGTYVATAVNSKSENIILIGNPSVAYVVEKQEIDANLIFVENAEYTGDVVIPVITDDTYNVDGKIVYTVEYKGDRVDVGRYGAELILEDFFNTKWKSVDVRTREMSFEIIQGTNELTSPISINGWVYGEYDDSKNLPSATVKFGGSESIIFTYSDKPDGVFTSGAPTKADAGTYYVRVTVLETKNWKRFDSEPVAFEISRRTLTSPEINKITVGAEANTVYTGNELKAAITGFDSTMMTVEYDGSITIKGDEITILATNAGTYTVTLSIKEDFKKNFVWDADSSFDSDGKLVITWTIAKKKIAKPTANNGEFIGNGTILTYIPVGFDADTMLIEGNVKDRGGDYTVTVTLKDTANYEWADGTSDAVVFEWHVVDGTIVFIVTASVLSVLAIGAAVGVVLLVRRKKKLSKRIEEEAADETAEETDSGESDEGDEE